jgi:hypothetical protein
VAASIGRNPSVITLDAIRTAVTASNPYDEMDRLVRAELAAGRKVKEVFDAINPLVDTVLETPGLTAGGEEAFLGTLDALTGGCHRNSNYYDSPGTAPPAGAEGVNRPSWAGEPASGPAVVQPTPPADGS